MAHIHNPPIATASAVAENIETPIGSIDGSNTVFTTTEDILSNSEKLFLNGQLLYPVDDYNVTGSNEITLLDAPKSAYGNPDKLRIVYTPV